MTPTEIKAAETKTLVAFYNQLTGKAIKKFESREIAEKRCISLLNTCSPSMIKHAGEVVAKSESSTPEQMTEAFAEHGDLGDNPNKQSKPRKAGLPGPNSQYAGKRIYKIVEKNPRREGTAGWTSFNVLKDGMTYEEYRLAGGRSNDLAWDIEHKFVEVK